LIGDASQDVSNSADSFAGNFASTTQNAAQSQTASTACLICSGSVQVQFLGQDSDTNQYADSDADADQDATNVAGLIGESDQTADNSASSEATNDAST